jgi:hypothetical protein
MRPWDLRLAVSLYTAPTAPVRRLRHAPVAAFASCNVQTPAPAAFKGEGSRGFRLFSRSRRRARHLILSGATAPGRAGAEQGVTAPCPRHRCRQARAAVEPSRPSLPSGPPSPSAPIASPATRGSHGAARCRTGAQQRPVYGQHAAGARLLHPEPVTHLKSVREGTNRPYGRSPSSSGDQTAVGELLPPAGTRLH